MWFCQFGEDKVERNENFKEIGTFDYSQHIISICTQILDSTNGTTSDFWAKPIQNYVNGKNFEKINIKMVINI